MGCLTVPEREKCFRLLQVCQLPAQHAADDINLPQKEDQNCVIEHKVCLAGPGADKAEIRKQVLQGPGGILPSKWRNMNRLRVRERPILFKEMQVNFFDF
jgi:hypothetical protein